MKELELHEKMYYACSMCSTGSNIQWHKPGTKIWHEHKKYIDLDETNSDRPKYFWCTYHHRPHDFNRQCLGYRAIITVNSERGNPGKKSQLSHEDALTQIRGHVAANTKVFDWKKIIGSNSLPWSCTRESRLLLPDIIYCESDKDSKCCVSITNVIEFETKTPAEKIVDKVQKYNISSKRMIEGNVQSKKKLPRIIFLYDTNTNISLNYVKESIYNLNLEYLDDVIVDYYDEKGGWFKYFQK
jgi:hypothetical protein